MKILLVMPGRILFEHLRMSFRALMPPGSLLEVAGMTDLEHHKLELWDGIARGPVPDDLLEWADVVGISGLTPSRLGAFLVAERAHQFGKTVIAGGMDVTGHFLEGNAEELLAHYDAIVVGRLTARLWAEVLADVENKRLKPVYQAESLKDEPWDWAIWRHDLVNPINYYFSATFRSSAGCSLGCEFCTIGLICEKVQVKPPEILEKELSLLPKSRWPWVNCCDAFGRKEEEAEFALPVLARAGHGWMTELTTRDAANAPYGGQSLLSRMSAAGAIGAYFGVESINTTALAKSPDLSIIEGVIEEAHNLRLITIASMVLDYTGKETEESILENMEWLFSNRLDLVQLSLVAALPGSKLRREALENELMICNNPEFFDGAWPTIKHKILTPKKRIELLRDAYYRIYSIKGIARRIFSHSHPWLNAIANFVVGRMSHNWWGQVGYGHWLTNGGIAV